jgi:hypothetical protein
MGQSMVDWKARNPREPMMIEEKLTLGQAIDQVEKALASFDVPDQQTILTAVCAHLKIAPAASAAQVIPPSAHDGMATGTSITPGPTVSPLGFSAGIDIKTLKNQKQPSSAKQMACVVAYYLAELAPEKERKQAVTVADLEKYFKQAGFPLNQKMEQLLVDGKRSGYFRRHVVSIRSIGSRTE